MKTATKGENKGCLSSISLKNKITENAEIIKQLNNLIPKYLLKGKHY